ncbi:MAG: sigma-54-dependent Fis family transcriptional regulator [Spirochaetes bacterium]|nr:sigma-54-dependent Fis family transcriptional regulator [Spirochaetota bacterium]
MNPASPPFCVLIVDDEEAVRRELGEYFLLEEFAVRSAATPTAALEALGEGGVDAVLLDVRLPEMDGTELLTRIKSVRPDLEVIMMSGHGDMDTVLASLRGGASDFFRKPFKGREAVAAIRRTRRYLAQASPPVVEGTAQAPYPPQLLEKVGPIIGKAAAFRTAVSRVARCAASPDCSVILTGESGTGKEIMARFLHHAGSRSGGPFVAVNCGAIPEALMESSFFGHRKGSFTGAHEDRAGFFEQAHGGTLFLDEVGDLPFEAQSKLLRALEERTVRRLGDPREIRVDFRLVCATHQDLARLRAEGRFRDDLFYRLATVEIRIPPLRERPDDLPALVAHFLALGAARMGREPPTLTDGALQRLRDHPFPGNIRELRNMMERALILSPGSQITAEDLAIPSVSSPMEPKSGKRDRTYDPERIAIENALRANAFHKTRTAESLGITIYTLLRRMKKLGIEIGKSV